MKVLKSAGSFKIFFPEFLGKELEVIEEAGRTCYQSERGSITKETASKFSRKLAGRHHYPVWDISWMVVKFFNCSRGFTHEMVRHRPCGFAQESTRYVDYTGGEKPDLKHFELKCVVPPHRDENEPVLLDDGRKMSCVQMLSQIEMFYRGLRMAGWLSEDARQVLPIATKSEIVVSADFTEWRHIFLMRTARGAHWEIRGVMGDLLEAVQGIVPVVFDDFVEAGTDKNGLRYFKQISTVD